MTENNKKEVLSFINIRERCCDKGTNMLVSQSHMIGYSPCRKSARRQSPHNGYQRFLVNVDAMWVECSGMCYCLDTNTANRKRFRVWVVRAECIMLLLKRYTITQGLSVPFAYCTVLFLLHIWITILRGFLVTMTHSASSDMRTGKEPSHVRSHDAVSRVAAL
jgi:hypothetical protein